MPDQTRFTFSRGSEGIRVHDTRWDGDVVAEVGLRNSAWQTPQLTFERSFAAAELARKRRFARNQRKLQDLTEVARLAFEVRNRREPGELTGSVFIGSDLSLIFLVAYDKFLVYGAHGILLQKLWIEWPDPSELRTPRRALRSVLGEYLRHFYETDPRD